MPQATRARQHVKLYPEDEAWPQEVTVIPGPLETRQKESALPTGGVQESRIGIQVQLGALS
jgi:hypothetical protein